MHEYPDKYFDLAIVDPPYGIGQTWKKNKSGKFSNDKIGYKNDRIPGAEYFLELFRVSKNQIIWGANYFKEHIPLSNNLICWDKQCTFEKEFKSEFELAWTSITKYPALIVRIPWSGGRKGPETKIKIIHPHQKPLALYRWQVNKFCKPGYKILDTHAGSASSLIIYEEYGLEYVAFEIDTELFEKARCRLEKTRCEMKLFVPSLNY
jgi:site-specific DNA-methyltransferase (adenine-specific)